MMQLKDLLKEGHKHLTGVNEVVLGNIEAVKELAEITRTSLGPNGMNKMVINEHGKLAVTNDAATIVKELDVYHPSAKLAVMASQMQEAEIGDGTNLVLILCGEFLQNAETLLEKGLHISEIIAGFTKAGKKALEILEGKDLEVKKIESVTNVDLVAQGIKSAIASKQYGYESMLAPLIAKACIEVLPQDIRTFNVDNVRSCKILGGGVLDTSLVKGFVLNRGVEGTIKHAKGVKVAVFSGGFESVKPETKDTLLITSADQLMNYAKSEELATEKIIKEIESSGAKVVVCGGTISEMALHFFERYKLMVVKVQSKFDLRRLCKAVGATPLGAPTAEELGYAEEVSVEEIGSDIVTVFRQSANKSGISTIVIRASTQNTLDDFERAIDDGVNVFKSMCRDGRFVAGAGACEIELAKRLAQFGDSTPGLVQYSIKKYAEAFEVIPRTLAENSGLKATDVLSNLYASHQKGNIHDGVDIENGTISNVAEKGIYDLLATKISAIRLATNAVVTILRIDQIIMAKAAGGPKIPQQGPMDTDD